MGLLQTLLRAPAQIAAITIIVLATACDSQSGATRYFPDGAFEENQAKWLSSLFVALQEPSLFNPESDGASYRVTSYPGLSYPDLVRIDVDDNGEAVLTHTIGSFADGSRPGKLSMKEWQEVSDSELEMVTLLFAGLGLCERPTLDPDEPMVLDAEILIVEYRKDGEYCINVRIWNFEPYMPVTAYMSTIAEQ